jgi:sec-independent protein translocase protein TatB
MPSFTDSIVIFILALLLFGPKKLPVLARELGKWIGEFRRASNEFKMQMEEELRISEQADRQKEIAAIEAAAPAAPALDGVPTEEPEHPHLDRFDANSEDRYEAPQPHTGEPDFTQPEEFTASPSPEPLPIATSGDLSIMPPSTGLPVAQSRSNGDLGPLIESIPVVDNPHHAEEPAESTSHG